MFNKIFNHANVSQSLPIIFCGLLLLGTSAKTYADIPSSSVKVTFLGSNGLKAEVLEPSCDVCHSSTADSSLQGGFLSSTFEEARDGATQLFNSLHRMPRTKTVNSIQYGSNVLLSADKILIASKWSATALNSRVQFANPAVDKSPAVVNGSKTKTSITIMGDVNDNGAAANYYFNYGIGNDLSNKIDATESDNNDTGGDGLIRKTASANITNLLCGTQYQVRMVGEDALSPNTRVTQGDTNIIEAVTFTTADCAAPVANNQSINVNEDSIEGIAIKLEGSDIDRVSPNERLLTYNVTGMAAGFLKTTNGTLTGSAHNYTYMPDPDFNGQDSFTFSISAAGSPDSNTATVSITVNSINDKPTVTADNGDVLENGSVNIDVRANDNDADNTRENLEVTILSQPQYGSVVNNNNGTVTYIHSGVEPIGNSTADTFTYSLNDKTNTVTANSDIATVTIQIAAVNDRPIAQPDNATVTKGGFNTFNIINNDTDDDTDRTNFTIESSSAVSNGTLVIDNKGNVIYTHDNSDSTAATFTYTINDNTNTATAISDPAIVTIRVTGPNIKPIANDDVTNSSVDEGSSVTINVRSNDTDADNTVESLQVTDLTQPSHGSLVNNNDGTVTYSHDGTEPVSINSQTTDSFTYRINDGSSNSEAAATVTIILNSINDKPVAVADSATLAQNSNVNIDLRSNDTDEETPITSMTVTNISTPAHGSVVNNGNGTVTYSHNGNEIITETIEDSFSYTINDGELDSLPVSVNLTIRKLNASPIFTALNSQTVTELSPFNLDAGASVHDANDVNNGIDLQWSLINAPQGMNISALGVIDWTPGENTADDYNITVTVADGKEDNVQAQSQLLTLTVTMLDGDTDTIADYSDNCIDIANTGQEDLDLDEIGDVCDLDIDGDGMPNTFETTHGLDPRDKTDADKDIDGDGLSNIAEYLNCIAQNDGECSQISVDNIEPIITVVDIKVPATGYVTTVKLIASAFDVKDGDIIPAAFYVKGNELVAITNLNKPFRPGRHIIKWSATDQSNNVATIEQIVDVIPLASLGGSVITDEGQNLRIPFKINGSAPQYPVIFNYSLSGMSDAADYDIVTGSIEMSEGRQIALSVNITDDAIDEADEDLIITLTSVNNNAVLSDETTYNIRISEQALAPVVNLTIEQNGISSNTIYQNSGIVEVVANATDGNGDPLIFDWSNSDIIQNASISANSFSFNQPENILATGNYNIEVNVSDGALQTLANLNINVVEVPPVLSVLADSDNDGIDDASEGLSDTDFDGIPDYLDAIDDETLLQIEVILASDNFKNVMQTQRGLSLKMGATAINSHDPGAMISSLNITDKNGDVVNDDNIVNFGGIFDFEIHGLTAIKPNAVLVIPLTQFIPEDGALYRKFINGSWVNFVENGSDKIRSAKKIAGVCPPLLSDSYQDGIAKFSQCLELTVTDGGPNDTDETINGVIVDPGGVGVSETSNQPEPSLPSEQTSARGAGKMPITLLGLLMGIFFVRVKKQRTSLK